MLHDGCSVASSAVRCFSEVLLAAPRASDVLTLPEGPVARCRAAAAAACAGVMASALSGGAEGALPLPPCVSAVTTVMQRDKDTA